MKNNLILLFVTSSLLSTIFWAGACAQNRATSHQLATMGNEKGSDLDFDFKVELPGGSEATLGAVFRSAPGWDGGAVVLIVPGAGHVSRRGTQRSNGMKAYNIPIPVVERWMALLSERGLPSMSYDKRTCRERHDKKCHKNTFDDVYGKGPAALAADVDAACKALSQEFNISPNQILLWTHGQGAQIVLSSECSKEAAGLVLLSPIPDRIDQVLIRSMEHRAKIINEKAYRQVDETKKQELILRANTMINKGESLKATFDSMDTGQFDPSANLLGVPLTFWKGWRDMTARTHTLIGLNERPLLIVMGEKDENYAPEDRVRLRQYMGSKRIHWLEIENADHHLVFDGNIKAKTADIVVQKIHQIVAVSPDS